jgi:hypothetical protein
MADYLLEAGDNALEPWTTTADQVDTVTFEENVRIVEVISNGAAEVRVTNGGSTPAIGSAGESTIAFRLPAGVGGVLEVPMPEDVDTLKLVSSGAALVSVQIPR